MSLLIHIIDDDELICSSLERLFLKKGQSVEVSRNGTDALARLSEIVPDLIFLDLSLPDFNGIDLLKKIRMMFPSVPVVMISGYGTIEIAVEALKLGAWDFLSKPLNLTTVNNTTENLLTQIRLEKQVQQIRYEQHSQFLSQHIVGQNQQIQQCYALAGSAAKSDRLTILITGESGTGKEALARYIHYNSPRNDNSLVTVNCSALPKDLVESELFGYEKGAFTGASTSGKVGKFEMAHGGTLFLDEIGDLQFEAQAKILRFLQEKELQRVGGTDTKHLDVRIVAATNRNLEELVKKGEFRGDLYYRLNVVRVHLPPLRERREDIPLFCLHFINLFNKEFGKEVMGLPPSVEDRLVHYDWPGNIRELRNVMERAVHLAHGPYFTEDLLWLMDARSFPQNSPPGGDSTHKPLREMVADYVGTVLEACDGNKSRAAEELEISRTRLRRIIAGSDQDG